ncbi:MAG: Rpn family recombination-promoting nuclease/putative transposase [Anaerolinea sp.]|nr:Rpn family recombination-promoting nuclease/putative transposase [Anaerolinea sp.]
MSIQNPHDHFFRESFGRVEIARNYLEEYLPADLRRLLDLTEMTLQDGSFIDEEMKEHQTDLIYQVRLRSGEVAYIYFLFEHKSYLDPLVALQLLRYLVRFWERQVKDGQSLSPIIPLVIYHGERAWHIATDFASLVTKDEEIRPYLPDFHYLLSDFSHLSDEAIRGHIWLRVSLSVLHAIFNPHLREELDDLVALMFQLSAQNTGMEYIRTILYYMSSATEKIKREDLQQALLRQGAEGKKLMNTIAQEFIQQGLQQGMQQGMEAAMRQNIMELLQLRLDVAATTFQEQLAQIDDLDDLRLLVRRAATVENVAQFVQALAILLPAAAP